MSAIELRPTEIDVWFRPGDPVSFRIDWPEGSLEGRTFQVLVDETQVGLMVEGDTMFVSATGDFTEDMPLVEWEVVDTTNSVDPHTVLMGHWRPSDEGVVTPRDYTIVYHQQSIQVTALGPPGQRGVPGAGASTASGSVSTPNIVWLMVHNLNQPESDLNPSTWWFTNDLGEPMEPVNVHYVNNNTASAEWLEPVSGSWRVS